MRLARNEEPAPNVLPPGIVPALASAQLADADKFVLFGPICCTFIPDVIELQLFPEADAAAAAAAAADEDDDDAPRPSFTCWAPILCGVVAFDYYSKIFKFDAQSTRTHARTHTRTPTKKRYNFAKLFFLFNFFCATFY